MRLYEIEPYNHKQKYAIQKAVKRTTTGPFSLEEQMLFNKRINSAGVQAGSGWGSALGKLGSVVGKIASNPAVQNLGKAGLEIGTIVAGNAIANKLAQSSQPTFNSIAEPLRDAVMNPAQTASSLLAQRDKIKEMYKTGEISKNDAIELIKKIDTMRQSGGVKTLKTLAKQQYGRGNVMSIRPVRYRPAVMPPNYVSGRADPIEINSANGLQTGGIGPIAIAGIASMLPLLASFVGPIVERISGKFVVPAMPGLG